MGSRVILTTDRTVMSEYRRIPLGDFLSCAPVEWVPSPVFNFFAPPFPHHDGVAIRAPYGVRKLEAALLREFRREDVVVVHPDRVEDFIDSETSIVGVNTMDPLSLGPVSSTFTDAGKRVSYSQRRFLELLERINHARRSRDSHFKLLVGGAGSWQFTYRRSKIRELGIDHVVVGETDHIAHTLFKDAIEDGLPEVTEVRSSPRVDEIPLILAPSLQGLVEVMRGCGRNCQFCDPTLRVARHMPIEKIAAEIRTNIDGGAENVWIQSDDIFLYSLEDRKNFTPNHDALIELFQEVTAIRGVAHCQPTHASIAPAVADPEMVAGLSRILRAGPSNLIGIQPGMETGSPGLLKRYMPLKAKPFAPEEWGKVVFEGTRIFNENYWFPAYTLVMGLPGETTDDAWDTLRLIDTLERKLPEKIGEKAHFIIAPLTFVPVGVMRGQEFFNAGDSISEASWCVMYRAWRHTFLEFERAPWFSLYNPGLASILWVLGQGGFRAGLWNLKRWGRKLGYDPEKAVQVHAAE